MVQLTVGMRRIDISPRSGSEGRYLAELPSGLTEVYAGGRCVRGGRAPAVVRPVRQAEIDVGDSPPGVDHLAAGRLRDGLEREPRTVDRSAVDGQAANVGPVRAGTRRGDLPSGAAAEVDGGPGEERPGDRQEGSAGRLRVQAERGRPVPRTGRAEVVVARELA